MRDRSVMLGYRPRRSTMIARVLFDDEAETLRVSFRPTGEYLYRGVPRALFDALTEAASAGTFFNAHIRDRFACEPIGRRHRPRGFA